MQFVSFWHVPYLNSLTAFLANPFFFPPIFLTVVSRSQNCLQATTMSCSGITKPCFFIFFLLYVNNPFPHEPIDPTLLHQRAFYPSSPLEILPLTHSHMLQQYPKTKFSLNFWLNFFHTHKIIPLLFEGHWNVFCWCC